MSGFSTKLTLNAGFVHILNEKNLRRPRRIPKKSGGTRPAAQVAQVSQVVAFEISVADVNPVIEATSTCRHPPSLAAVPIWQSTQKA